MCRLVSGSVSSPGPPLAPLQAPRSTAASARPAPHPSAPSPGPARPRRNIPRGRCAGRQRPRRNPSPDAVRTSGKTISPCHELFMKAEEAGLFPEALLTCYLLPKGGGWHRARPCPAGSGEPRPPPWGVRGSAARHRPSPHQPSPRASLPTDCPPPQQNGEAAQFTILNQMVAKNYRDIYIYKNARIHIHTYIHICSSVLNQSNLRERLR